MKRAGGPDPNEEPRTEAGRRLWTSWQRFHDFVAREVGESVPGVDAVHGTILAIEQEAAAFDLERLAQAIHDSGVASCRVECASPVGGGYSGADADFATLLAAEYEHLARSKKP